MKTIQSISLAVVVSALLGTAPTLPAAEVPIKGKFSGTLSFAHDPDGTYRVIGSASGIISHLGKVTAEVVFRDVSLDLLTGQITVGVPVWTGTITAANGDQIFGEYEIPTNAFDIPANGRIPTVAELRVTGGTGRFRNGGGHAAAMGEVNVPKMTFTLQVEGVVEVGKSK